MVDPVSVHAVDQLFNAVGFEQAKCLHKTNLAEPGIEIAADAAAIVHGDESSHFVMYRFAQIGYALEKWIGQLENMRARIFRTKTQLRVCVLDMGVEVNCIESAVHLVIGLKAWLPCTTSTIALPMKICKSEKGGIKAIELML